MGLIGEFLAADHARLNGLLVRSRKPDGTLDLEPFGAFREGLLRHIGMEEKILLPALLRSPEAPRELMDRLRLDHGALTNLLVPEPAPEILRAVESILERHNPLEEGPGGFYDACDTLPRAEVEALVRRLRSAPEVPLRPYSRRPEALAAAKRAMKRAGYDWDACTAVPHGR